MKIHWGKRLARMNIDATDQEIDDALDEVCQTTCDQVTPKIVNAADRHNLMSLSGVLI